MPDYKSTAETFIKKWLSGFTCSRFPATIFWHSKDWRFVVAKHSGHNEWCGGYSGNQYCETYYELHDMALCEGAGTGKKPFISYRSEPTRLRLWEGRWLKKYHAELELDIAALFQSEAV